MKSSRINIVLIVIFGLLFFAFIYLAKEASSNRDDQRLKDLQHISIQIPVFPQFREVSSHYSSRFLDAGVYKYYHSTANYGGVKGFYLNVLTKEGWSLTREDSAQDRSKDGAEKKIVFEKGDYRTVIEYAGSNDDRSWNYAVNFLWR